MEDIRKGITKIFNMATITSAVILVLGIFLFLEPEMVIHLISWILGVMVIIPGVIGMIDYFKSKRQNSLVMGIVTVLIGIVIILNSKIIASILPFALGIYFIVNGLNNLLYLGELRKQKIKNPASIVISIFIVLCGILFIINPFSGALAITKVMGIFMILYAILYIINFIVIKREMHLVKYNVIEAQIEEKSNDNGNK